MAVVIPAPVLTIPTMIVLDPAMLAIPISSEEPAAFVSGSNPVRPAVRYPSPIPVMPFIAVPDRVPVSVYPEKPRPWADRAHAQYTRWRRRPNCDSKRNLGGAIGRGQQNQSG